MKACRLQCSMPTKLLTIYDYERAAAEVMEPAYHAYYAGGVADNLTRDDNRAAFDRLKLLPRVLRDVSSLTTATTVASRQLAAPMLIAPTAMAKLAHPDGEIGIGKAAKKHGIIQILSTMSTHAVEEVASIGHDVWFQLYIFKDRGVSKAIVQRAIAAGCTALVVTVDVPVIGLRQSLARANFHSPVDMRFPNLMISDGEGGQELVVTMADQVDPSLDWGFVDWLRSFTSVPIWVKGILNPADAVLAVQAGLDGIIVSNHGGRQLDTAVASIDALPAVADAVKNDVPLLMDGGVRRGTDILKALALGAQSVLIGRPPLWGLAVDGERGVDHAIQILKNELENVMAQAGCASVDEITKSLIFNS